MKSVSIGSRIACSNVKGTVKFIGEVPPTKGEWYGIDWDDPERGKHDGSKDGVQYFQTKFDKSGSFVRPSKVETGIDLEQAVRDRYQDDPTIEDKVTAQLQKSLNARFVEVVGMEKVGRQQSVLEDLTTVVLDGWNVDGPGTSDLKALFPRLRFLDLSNTLISNWHDVASICRQLPSLKFLNLSNNVIVLPDQLEELKTDFDHIKEIVLHHMMNYCWQDLLKCIQLFPNLGNLQLAFNDLKEFSPVEGLLDNLVDLDIGCNPIENWQQVCYFGTCKNLKKINIRMCKIDKIEFKDTLQGEKTDLFPSLESLIIADNPLTEEWSSMNELSKLRTLFEIVVNPDVAKRKFFVEFAVARIDKLRMINRSTISNKERKDAELFYLKSFNKDFYESGGSDDPCNKTMDQQFLTKHPRYLNLVQMHGTPMDERSMSMPSTKLKDLKLNLTLICPLREDIPHIDKTFLPTTKVSKVKMMVKRALKLDTTNPLRLSYWSPERNEDMEIEIDDDSKEITFYSISKGDHLFIRW